MSLSCLSWGAGRNSRRRAFHGTPFDDRVSRERFIWFLVGPRAVRRDTIELAGCTWKLVSTTDVIMPLERGKRAKAHKLVYQRVGDAPNCTQFS